MPPKKYAIKGEPDFHRISDVTLTAFVDLTQQLIFAYNQCDSEKTEVLKSIWKELSNEEADRRCRSALCAVEERDAKSTSAPLMRKVPKMRKSPAKRKI